MILKTPGVAVLTLMLSMTLMLSLPTLISHLFLITQRLNNVKLAVLLQSFKEYILILRNQVEVMIGRMVKWTDGA